MFRRKNKKLKSQTLIVPCMRGTSTVEYSGGKTDLLTRYLIEEIERNKHRPKPISPQERCEYFTAKYKDIELRTCPLCNSQSYLTISLREYTQNEGFAGGYDINAKIGCLKCKCGLDAQLLYTNIRFSGDQDNIEHVDEIVFTYAKEWNTRYDDFEKLRRACRHVSPVEPFFVDIQRPDDYSEDKPDE